MTTRRLLGGLGVVVSALALAACAGVERGTVETVPGETPAPAETGAPVPEPAEQAEEPALSARAYQELLSACARRIGTALDRVEEARTHEGLSTRTARAATVLAREHDRLAAVTPPDDVAGPHAQLAAAVGALGTAAGKAADAVESCALCGAPSVTARLGGTAAARDLRAATRLVEAAGYEVGRLSPRAVPMPARRLATGVLSSTFGAWGRGEVTFENGLGLDAFVTLTRAKQPVATAYVRRRDAVEIDGIPDGTYRVFFTVGADWDDELGTFTRRCAFDRFDDPLVFTTTETAATITWSTYRLTLHPVAGGTASTTDVAPDDFPR